MKTQILAALLLLGVSVYARAGDPQVPESAIEAPSTTVVTAQHPWLEHVGGSVPAPAAAAASSVDQQLLAPVSAAELEQMRTQQRAHIQGSPPATSSDLSPALPLDSSPPRFEQSFPQLPLDISSPTAQGAILTNFNGIAATGWFPPDTVVAVGPSQVLASTNSGYAIYSKTGRQIRGYTSFDSFFAGLRPANWATNGGFMFDPKVYYDWYHKKFIMFVLGREDVNETSHFYIAISKTEDASAGWWSWRFDWPETNTWVDYSSISADQWGMYITGNVFYFGDDFRYAQLWTLSPEMFSGGSSAGWRFWDLRWPLTGDPTIFNLQAARPLSNAGDAASFFVNSSSGSDNQMALWKLTGDRTNAPTLTRAAIPTGTYYPVGLNVRQPDTATRIDGFSTQIVEAVYSQRRVWATMTSGENSATPSWGGMYTTRFDVDSNTMDWDSLIWTGGQYYTFPAVTVGPGTVTATGPNVGLFATWTASDRYASTIFHITAPGGTNSFSLYHSGAAPYEQLDDSGRNRWGDYSGISYDWTCKTLWGAAEYASAVNRWGTRIAEVDFIGTGACPRIDVIQPLDSSTWQAGNTATVHWTRSNIPTGNQMYVRLYNNGTYVAQLAGPLASSASSATVTMPWISSTLAQIKVGSWNPGTSVWEVTDLSDAYFTVAASPDLLPSSFSSDFGSVAMGGALKLNTTIKNAGNAISSSSFVRFYRSSNAIISSSDTLLGTSPISALSAGSSTNRQLTTSNTGTPGTWYFGACVDVIPHDPAGNNCSAGSAVTVTDVIFKNGFE